MLRSVSSINCPTVLVLRMLTIGCVDSSAHVTVAASPTAGCDSTTR